MTIKAALETLHVYVITQPLTSLNKNEPFPELISYKIEGAA